jgi:hypothetical protein
VLLLDLVTEAIGLGEPRVVRSVKFHRSLSPGEAFDLSWTVNALSARFRCQRGDELVADGVIEFGPP